MIPARAARPHARPARGQSHQRALQTQGPRDGPHRPHDLRLRHRRPDRCRFYGFPPWQHRAPTQNVELPSRPDRVRGRRPLRTHKIHLRGDFQVHASHVRQAKRNRRLNDVPIFI